MQLESFFDPNLVKGISFSENPLPYFEQLAPVGGVVHGYKYVGKAVDCFHVAACRYPYHFRERLRDCPGDKVYLILADFPGYLIRYFG